MEPTTDAMEVRALPREFGADRARLSAGQVAPVAHPRLLLCVPVLAADWEKRAASRTVVLRALGASLKRLREGRVTVVVAVNGADLTGTLSDHLQAGTLCLATTHSTVRTTHYPTYGKIATVNVVLAEAAAGMYDGFMVLDDDVVIDAEVLPEAIRFLRRQQCLRKPLCFYKYSVPAAAYPEATTFQRQMARLFHPSACRLLSAAGESPLRPSGSAYVLPRSAMRPFPDPCNEAEELAESGYEIAAAAVRTWYPSSVTEEALRRYRHRVTNECSPVARPRKDRAFVVPWSDIAKSLGARGPLGSAAELALEDAYMARLTAIRFADHIA